ncbi:MAG: hypothetical protein JXX14_26260 [Deltaproteobacteria bacterium]|nr:hypothetical protein [Deltaproteobacteria bacterium]
MDITVEHIQEKREPFGPYRYNILQAGQKIAVFWHDYRGDMMGIHFLSSGFREDPPFASISDFVTGGGPYPLALSDSAMEYVISKLNK